MQAETGPQSGPTSSQQPTGGNAPADATDDVAPSELGFTPGVSSCVDVIESENELIVFMDTPGFDKEEIDIEADEHSLILTAERSPESEEDHQFLQQERPTTIQREIPLPSEVKIDEAEATYDKGVTRIALPKHEEDEGRHTIGFQ